MIPREYKIYEQNERQRIAEEKDNQARNWRPPALWSSRLLDTILKEMAPFALNPKAVPFIIRLIENPKYDIGLFGGATTLRAHDCIHILLGRGLLLKDEAFVIGYTMGSSKNLSRWRKNLFLFCTKHLYPEAYKFGEEERFVFNLGAAAGSKCSVDLSAINFKEFIRLPLLEIRDQFGIKNKTLLACYDLEMDLFSNSEESQRLKYHK